MSQQQHSIYGDDSIPEISGFDLDDMSNLDDKSNSLILSDNSVIPLSKDDDEMSHGLKFIDLKSRTNNDSDKTESRSIVSYKPFIFDGKYVKYNKDIDKKSPLLLGKNFIYNPETGTLSIGRGHSKVQSNYSLITGFKNSSESDCSVVSGVNNRIKTSKIDNKSIANAILASKDSTIIDSESSAIMGSDNVTINKSKNTVVLGVSDKQEFNDYENSAIVNDLYILGKQHFGPKTKEPLPDSVVSSVNGDQSINGNLNVSGHIDADSITSGKIVGISGSFQNLSVAHVQEDSLYVAGSSGPSGTIGDYFTDITITKGDGIDVVYVNPSPGPIRIQLGTTNDASFENNRQIIFKDVSVEFGSSSHNVYIWAPPGVRVEHYNTGTGLSGLTATENGIYVLNSSGGSVTFRYSAPFIPGAMPVWMITGQFIGNPRLLPGAGVKFIPATINQKSLLIKKK